MNLNFEPSLADDRVTRSFNFARKLLSLDLKTDVVHVQVTLFFNYSKYNTDYSKYYTLFFDFYKYYTLFFDL